MNTINETDLIDAIRNKAIKKFNIVQTAEGKYRIFVNLSKISISSDWKEGDLTLISTRNSPREWASLDRLEKHIRMKYGAIPAISLSLNFDLPEN
ncbi:hypothetical protein WL93_26570 [Burkholderia diffusa]|uniref:hypothetical protein n=1 Tax=Burkholderia diffusa TaxID=488732 RepID=UPI0007570E52|nr:hypothetical protein [Burkholderia diffusa]KWF77582.1 hypothetical protein WL93_26570 [Burkholderia diffusa]